MQATGARKTSGSVAGLATTCGALPADIGWTKAKLTEMAAVTVEPKREKPDDGWRMPYAHGGISLRFHQEKLPQAVKPGRGQTRCAVMRKAGKVAIRWMAIGSSDGPIIEDVAHGQDVKAIGYEVKPGDILVSANGNALDRYQVCRDGVRCGDGR